MPGLYSPRNGNVHYYIGSHELTNGSTLTHSDPSHLPSRQPLFLFRKFCRYVHFLHQIYDNVHLIYRFFPKNTSKYTNTHNALAHKNTITTTFFLLFPALKLSTQSTLALPSLSLSPLSLFFRFSHKTETEAYIIILILLQ